MQTSTSIIVPAKDVSLLTLYEAKLALNLAASTVKTIDDQIEMFIRWSSGTIADFCNRVFARETLVERILELEAPRIQLTHYPVVNINSVTEDGTVLTTADYDLDTESGFLTRLGGTYWKLPVEVDYTGGYDLPFEAPQTLRQAAILMTREAYNAMLRGDATVRMVSHKEARIIYFDPNAAALKSLAGGGKGGTAAMRAIGSLLEVYQRIYV